MLPTEVINRIKNDFNADEVFAVENLLSEYDGNEPERVIRFILHIELLLKINIRMSKIPIYKQKIFVILTVFIIHYLLCQYLVYIDTSYSAMFLATNYIFYLPILLSGGALFVWFSIIKSTNKIYKVIFSSVITALILHIIISLLSISIVVVGIGYDTSAQLTTYMIMSPVVILLFLIIIMAIRNR